MLRSLFSARLLALHALGIAAVTAASLLGVWQLGAWQAGRELEVRDLTNATPVALDSVLTSDAPFPNDQVGRPVELAGTWLPASTVEVTDRSLDGRVGRWVVTPVAVCASPAEQPRACAGAPAMLVVRGWLAPGEPLPPAPEGAVEVSGWLQPGEGSGLPDDDPTDAVLPELRIASAIQRVDQDLYGGYVIGRDLTGTAADGLEPVTPDSLPQPGSFTSLRNLLYALEWWVFAGFALYIWVRWVRDDLGRTRQAERAGTDDEAVPPAEIPSSP